MSSATSSVHTARAGRSKACYALIAVRATVAQLFCKLSDRLVFSGGAPALPLGVVACAVRREFITLSHIETWQLALGAAMGALIIVACISWPQVSRLSLKTQTVERKKT